jgi:hypothetical protein
MSIEEFIIFEESQYKGKEKYLNYLKEKTQYRDLMIKFLKSTKLNYSFTRLNSKELKTETLKYFTSLNMDEKLVFSKYFDNFLMQYISKKSMPLDKDFDDFKNFLISVNDNTFWEIENKNRLFKTVSNKDFFDYVMLFFKNERVMYNQRTLSYVYWRMERVFYGKNGLYIRYVNENYKDLKPLKKVLSRSVIQSQYILEQRNVLFNKAMKSWNEKNQCFQKNFEPLYLLIK